ncbi:MAG: winged helix-turn-helix domain-containing protein [Candidatus Woesearchaeota archaeon]
MNRRSKLEILNDILDVIYNQGEVKITHLMYKANLSYKKLKDYLEKLKENDMVEIDEKNNTVKLKEKGVEFLREFYRLKQFADSFGLD